jgi:dihydrofolate synthase/folylpolyglutamate synthase
MASQAQPEQITLPSDIVLARLRQLHPRSIDLSLDRIERLLEKMGHPERQFPPVLHIAGTNGKGSTLAFVRACLEQAGYRVHVYTSPHLVRFNERIRLAGELIDDGHLQAVLEECERINAGDAITEFEVVTAAAFLAFREVKADVLLLETGLGGIYDATNVIDQPALTAITPVSMDHPQFLGNTVDEIAISKAGILKPGVVGVINRQIPTVQKMMETWAQEIGASLFIRDRDWFIERKGDRLQYRDGEGGLELPLPNLRGSHQTDNAGLAVACLRNLAGFSVSPAHIEAGLQTADWPARLQQLESGPVLDQLPNGSECWLDGGHNEAAGKTLASTIRRWQAEQKYPRPLHFIFSMLSSKEPVAFFEHFKDLPLSVHCVPIPDNDATVPPNECAQIARDLGFQATVQDDAVAAAKIIAEMCDNNDPPPLVLICGSLYLAGTILSDHL